MPVPTIRLLIDEDVWQGLGQVLHEAGYDAVSINDRGGKGLSDEDVLALAIRENRALLTHNIQDFVPLAERCYFEGIAHPGIIVACQLSKGEILRRTLTMLQDLSPDLLANTLRFL